MLQEFTTYILFSKNLDVYYIGYTGDSVRNRLSKHLGKQKGFTARAKDWEIVYTEIFPAKKEALNREKQLKGWNSKLRIRELISRATQSIEHPDLRSGRF